MNTLCGGIHMQVSSLIHNKSNLSVVHSWSTMYLRHCVPYYSHQSVLNPSKQYPLYWHYNMFGHLDQHQEDSYMHMKWKTNRRHYFNFIHILMDLYMFRAYRPIIGRIHTAVHTTIGSVSVSFRPRALYIAAGHNIQSARPEQYRHWTNGCVNSCMNSPEDGPVGPKHVEIRRYMNKIEIVTSVGFPFHMLKRCTVQKA
jgi:hypothetical protein